MHREKIIGFMTKPPFLLKDFCDFTTLAEMKNLEREKMAY